MWCFPSWCKCTPMATVHIIYACLLMVVLLFDLMITPLTLWGTLWHPVCATLWHPMPWADSGVVRATGQIIGLIVPATQELWISEDRSEACWAEWKQRCFHALLKCSHLWEEHSSSHWQGHQQHFLFQVHLYPQLGWEKHNIVSATFSVPPSRDFLHHTTGTPNLLIYFSIISTGVADGWSPRMESS